MKFDTDRIITSVLVAGTLVGASYVWGFSDSNRSVEKNFGFAGLPNCRLREGPSALTTLSEITFPKDASEMEVNFNADGGRVSYVWNGTEYEVYYGPGCQMSRLSTSPTPVK